MSPSILALLLIVVGVLNLGNIIRLLRNDEALTTYVEQSPKAWLWRKWLGVEGAKRTIRRVFGPIGVVASVVFVGLGVQMLLAGG
ncbi:MAG: hypothetical protein H6739_38990 [Alphaproteobacteria bacterium]|nr:hypothetical protein [Alphaproteobacteria bacterium]